MDIEMERVREGLASADPESVLFIVVAALALEVALYSGVGVDEGPSLFRLRKSLEAVWGHDLPEVKE
jgi:hypothetical protein